MSNPSLIVQAIYIYIYMYIYKLSLLQGVYVCMHVYMHICMLYTSAARLLAIHARKSMILYNSHAHTRKCDIFLITATYKAHS